MGIKHFTNGLGELKPLDNIAVKMNWKPLYINYIVAFF
jgi:hypothetical protein